MRVLITGGAGFVGSHLCDRFIAEGYEVLAMDNLITGNLRNIQHLQANPSFKFINHDVSEPFEIEGELDIVLHFASPASPPHYLRFPIETMKVGSYGTHNALEIARQKNARFLIASTSEVYGDPLEHPQKESYWGNVNSIGVRSVYDEAKRYGEAITMAYHRQFGVKTHIVRIFNTYGPRMSLEDGRVVPNFVSQAIMGQPLTIYGEGKQTRSFQYVDDLVEGLYRLVLSDEPNPVNIGNPNELTIIEFAEVINRLTDNPAGITFMPQSRVADDPQQRRPDITRARDILGWEPRVSLAEGLEKTIAYFQSISDVISERLQTNP